LEFFHTAKENTQVYEKQHKVKTLFHKDEYIILMVVAIVTQFISQPVYLLGITMIGTIEMGITNLMTRQQWQNRNIIKIIYQENYSFVNAVKICILDRCNNPWSEINAFHWATVKNSLH
jgi:hypothetical protein